MFHMVIPSGHFSTAPPSIWGATQMPACHPYCDSWLHTSVGWKSILYKTLQFGLKYGASGLIQGIWKPYLSFSHQFLVLSFTHNADRSGQAMAGWLLPASSRRINYNIKMNCWREKFKHFKFQLKIHRGLIQYQEIQHWNISVNQYFVQYFQLVSQWSHVSKKWHGGRRSPQILQVEALCVWWGCISVRRVVLIKN